LGLGGLSGLGLGGLGGLGLGGLGRLGLGGLGLGGLGGLGLGRSLGVARAVAGRSVRYRFALLVNVGPLLSCLEAVLLLRPAVTSVDAAVLAVLVLLSGLKLLLEGVDPVQVRGARHRLLLATDGSRRSLGLGQGLQGADDQQGCQGPHHAAP